MALSTIMDSLHSVQYFIMFADNVVLNNSFNLASLSDKRVRGGKNLPIESNPRVYSHESVYS